MFRVSTKHIVMKVRHRLTVRMKIKSNRVQSWDGGPVYETMFKAHLSLCEEQETLPPAGMICSYQVPEFSFKIDKVFRENDQRGVGEYAAVCSTEEEEFDFEFDASESIEKIFTLSLCEFTTLLARPLYFGFELHRVFVYGRTFAQSGFDEYDDHIAAQDQTLRTITGEASKLFDGFKKEVNIFEEEEAEFGGKAWWFETWD